MLDVGLLRHRLTIMKLLTAQDEVTGETQELWSELMTVWGSFTPYSTRERLAAASAQSSTSVRAVIRYRTDVLPEMRVLFRDKYYEIEGPPLPDPDSGLEYMTLMLKEIEVESITEATSFDLGFVRTTLELDSDETSFVFDDAFVAGSLLVFINGVLATPGDEYTEKEDLAGIDLTSAPEDDDVVEVFYKKVILAIVNFEIGFARETLDADGAETSFVFDNPFLSGSLLVFINGVLATPGDEYTEKTSKSGVDFVSAPENDDVVEVRYAKVA